MSEIKATSNYLNKKMRQQNEARLISIYCRLDECVTQIRMTCNTSEKETIIARLDSAAEYIMKARTLATDLE